MNVAEIVKELGYTSQWLKWGIIDEAYLQSQYEIFVRSDDKNQEHYRCRAFADFLGRSKGLTDDSVEKIFLLTDCGPDRCDLVSDRIGALILSGVLTDEQHFALAERHPEVLEMPHGRLYRRKSLLRKIRKSGLAANFAEIQASADSSVQLSLFDHPELTREHLQWLREAGANKSIRNRAAAMLRSKRFREA